jgi:hypothetical protein
MKKYFIFNNPLSETLTNEIGSFLNFNLWINRDKTKDYIYKIPYIDELNKKNPNYMEDYVIVKYMNFYRENRSIDLLIFTPNVKENYYSLNLKTLNPTKNSPIQTNLSIKLKKKIL